MIRICIQDTAKLVAPAGDIVTFLTESVTAVTDSIIGLDLPQVVLGFLSYEVGETSDEVASPLDSHKNGL